MVSIRKWHHLGMQERYKILNQLNERKHAMEPKTAFEDSHYEKAYQDSMETGEKNMVPEDESFKMSSCSVKDSNTEYPSPSMYPGINISKDPSVEFQGKSSGAAMSSQGSIGKPSFVEGPGQKSRKSTRRKQPEKQDTCLLRGVYFKNMKWQAAIKVDKKQIHLGTVASMEEAARLYDRAAYLCGRIPNFELTEEEQQELQGLDWEEFLQITKASIANKKKQRRVETSMRRPRALEPLEDDGYPHQYAEPTSAYHLASFGEPKCTTQHVGMGFDGSLLEDSAFVAATLKSLQQQARRDLPAYGLSSAAAAVASGPFYQQTTVAGTSPYA